MSLNGHAPDIARLKINDEPDDVDGLFDTPGKGTTTPRAPVPHQTDRQRHEPNDKSKSEGADREQRLLAELSQLKTINSTLERLNTSLSSAKVNLSTMQTNMDSTKTLLKTWSRILSQAEHNQRLLLDPTWQGATKDIEELESEESRRQEEAERLVYEEARRKEEAEERRQREEARRQEESQKKASRGLGRARSTRGNVIGASRGQSAAIRGRGSVSSRGTSGIARGAAATRGRGRG